MSHTFEKSLGMHTRMLRRDFMNGLLIGSGGMLLGGTEAAPEEFTGVGDYRGANGNPPGVMQAAHAVRDGAFDLVPSDVIEESDVVDCVIVGGGISGLAAALVCKTEGTSGRTCLVLENHRIFGGEARRNEFEVDGQRLLAPQGANQFHKPARGKFMEQFYEQVGFNWHELEYQDWGGPGDKIELSRTSYQQLYTMPPSFGFYFGANFGQRPGIWVADPWRDHLARAPFSTSLRSELLKWRNAGRSPFKPQTEAEERRLDAITLEDHMIEQEGLSRDMIRLFYAPLMAQGHGVGPDALSAYSRYVPSVRGEDDSPQTGWQNTPGGLAELSRHIVKTLIPDAIEGPGTLEAICRNPVKFEMLDRARNPVRIRLDSTVVRVEHEREPEKSDFVKVTYTRGGKTFRIKARSVVMAGGGWSTRRVLRDLPSSHKQAYEHFCYSAALVANVAVRNWKFLYDLGLSGGRWFGGLGTWTEVRKVAKFGAASKTIGPDSPTVLTLYVPLFYPGLSTMDQGQKGRLELISTPFKAYEAQIREQFVDMFSRSGFDALRDIAGLILNRWGHAYVNPGPGFYFGKDGEPAPQQVLRQRPFGRIAFAHCDLTGYPYHPNSIQEGQRAMRQLISVLDKTGSGKNKA
jgi:spermidine dehydrogenase